MSTKIGPYQLYQQIDANVDGTAYLARDALSGRGVEVRVLDRARNSLDRWEALSRRIRASQLLKTELARRVLRFEDHNDPPYLVVDETMSTSFHSHAGPRIPWNLPDAVEIIRDLAVTVVEAHRLGLVHGHLDSSRILVDTHGRPRLDYTRLDPAGGTVAPLDPADDIRGLGGILAWLIGGDSAAEHGLASSRSTAVTLACSPDGDTAESNALMAVDRLVGLMCAHDPDARPSARELVLGLEGILASITASSHAETRDSPSPEASALGGMRLVGPQSRELLRAPDNLLGSLPMGGEVSSGPAQPVTLGRYRLLEKLGQGGMGSVYRGEDVTDGTVVAIKVLRPEWASRPGALRRFQKEARLLGEVNNAFVTNLLEVNEDDNVHYLVLEFVQGQTLGKILQNDSTLPEPLALSIISDVARALVEAHERGIVHRDIKPDNVLLSDERPGQSSRVKLSDFGLARHVVESESLQVTLAHSIVGTPQYMAPEQGIGGTIDPRTDVYSMGVTLFRMLTGRVPFTAPSLNELISQHCHLPPPSVRKLNPEVTEGAIRIIEKALAKAPDLRYSDAGAMLEDLDRLIKGEATSPEMHPRIPLDEANDALDFEFIWDLKAAPRQLWPFVTNTERLNHAIGLPAVTFRNERDPATGRIRRFGEAHQGGLSAQWEEHAYEWIEPRRMGVLREYQRGPFRWMMSSLELLPRLEGGTRLTHRVKIAPRGLLMRAAASIKVGRDTKRALERVYRRIDASVTGKLESSDVVDPFEEPPPLPQARRRRLERLLDGLTKAEINPSVVSRLGEFVATAPAQEVTRIRPLALARRLGLDASQTVAACLRGAHDGLLVMLWDLVCPLCRIPSEVKETLRQLESHGRCEACGLDFELDFANSVEMIFRVHPEVREADLGVYCIGGPSHSPHVVAQVRIAPGERLELDLGLSEGKYVIRGPQLPVSRDFRVEPSNGSRRLEVDLREMAASSSAPSLRAGAQRLILRNTFEIEIVVRIERTASRDDALTAAKASTLALFRELFPGEILSAGQLISIATTTLMMTALEDTETLYSEKGDAAAFALIHEHIRLLESLIRQEGGALVKTIGAGVMAAFSETASAVRVGLALPEVIARSELTRGSQIRASIHRGPAMAVTINDHLDYFGLTVAQVSAMLLAAGQGKLLLSQPVVGDPSVMAVFRARRVEIEVVDVELPGRSTGLVHRVRRS